MFAFVLVPVLLVALYIAGLCRDERDDDIKSPRLWPWV